jgi:hypothetical protein
MLSLPREPNDPLKLADWLELYALISGDRNSSHGDLVTALKAASVIDPREIAQEELPTTVFEELLRREKAARGGYPFEVDGSVLRCKKRPLSYETYIFCLCLSYFSWKGLQRGAPVRPDRVFEHLCAEVARAFLVGEARRFGAPRVAEVFASSFPKAVDELAAVHLQEGGGFKAQDEVSASGDAGLDIVAWRKHPDEMPGKLIFFGACASGGDWAQKLHEQHTPATFAENFMANSMVSRIVGGFFIPHRVPTSKWDRLSRKAGGMLFDRCRIAHWSPRLPRHCPSGSGLQWAKSKLAAVR